MNRLSDNNNGTAASTEYYVVNRILAGLLAAACMLGANAANAANVLPSVSLTTPVANSQYTAPAAVPLTAVASDPDGTIASVTYYRGTTWIGSSSVAPYSVHWSTAVAGTYSITARATDNLGGVTISAPVSVVMKVNAAPTVAIVSPLNNASFTAPGTIALKASAADADGTINRVAYYNGAAYLGASTTSPYSFNWTNVAAGSYSITAKVYDNKNAVTTSAPITVTVTAPVAATQVFYVYTDQINTAQEITNAAGVKVWQADPEPFGANLPNENPAGQGAFIYNPRFPGQYYDKETGLHYNYHRDYDPQIGRYIQSDPIGLAGGINTYAYVGGNPLTFIDPLGLADKSLFNPFDHYGTFWVGARAWSRPDAYTVAAHGSQVHVEGPDKRWIFPGELAEMIKKDKNWRGRPIVLAACLTGRDYKDKPSFAQQLADKLGVAVMAPTDYVWYDYGGMVGAGEVRPPSGTMGTAWTTKIPR